MKKIKFVGLPILALTAIAGLASCNGEGAPKQKPGVIFHASAAIIKDDDGDGTPVEKAIDFKDKECATVTINNEEGLQYGKQDVEIFVEPKGFFTFRKYEPEFWTALPGSMPAHPYVGLGSPVSLYTYPLQENVAWTFTDLSEQIKDEHGDFTGFYNEKYKITVKKEYFQKNIVVDYGNVEGLNNRVYVYNSDKYSKEFANTPITGGFSNYYTIDTEASSFAAASLGMTVTYKFNNDSNLDNIYTFDGWDDAPTQSANSNADKIAYSHFKVYGVYHDEHGDEKKDNLAMYEPGVAREDQSFIPTVITKDKKEYLSFFIKWDLLAYGKEKGYENKYETVEVEFKEPTPKHTPIDVQASEGIKVYPGGLFQHPNSLETKALDRTGTYNTYTKDSTGKEVDLTFENVLDEGNNVYYAILFELPENDKDSFAISVNGKTVFDINLVYDTDLRVTTGHTIGSDGQPITGESELFYWHSGDWRLVQLNPAGGDEKYPQIVERTNGLPTEFQGKSNLYYLYSSGSSPLSKSAPEINIELVETQITTFQLTQDALKFGTFAGGKDNITLPCGDKSSVKIPFMAKALDAVIFTVTSGTRDDLAARFIEKDMSIEVYSKSLIPFGNEVTCTIDIKAGPTKVQLIDESTKELGSLYYNGKEVEEYQPTITENEPVEFLFKLKSGYSAKDLAPEVLAQVTYNGGMLGQNTITVSPDTTDNTILHITVAYDSRFESTGGLFKLSVKYVDLVSYSDNLGGVIDKSGLYEIVSDDTSVSAMYFRVNIESAEDLTNYQVTGGSITTSKYGDIRFSTPTFGKGGFQHPETNKWFVDLVSKISIKKGSTLKKIPNGIDLTISLTFGPNE